ncbi:MAG TPA: hypothetical protein VFU12_20745 [Glycomyces sp.]|nr:hypothetical protein [Glycomyces sp.]
MASIDELSSAIGANKDAVEQANAGLAAAMSNADELSGQFQGLGADDKVAGVEQVRQSLEQVQQTLASARTAIEAAQAQAEALRGLKGGTGGGISAGGGGAGREAGAAEKDAPAPAGSGSESGSAEDDADRARSAEGMRIWLPGDDQYERLRNGLGDPLQPPEEMDPADDANLGKARRFGRHFIRKGEDLSNFGKDLASSTSGVHKGMSLPDSRGYETATLTPEIHAVDQPAPPPGPAPNDLVGNTILMTAVLTEAGARMFDRFTGRRNKP